MNARFGAWWQKLLVRGSIFVVVVSLLGSWLGTWADVTAIKSELPCFIRGDEKVSGPYRIAVANIAVRRKVRTLSNSEEGQVKEINKQLFKQISDGFRDQPVEVGVGKPCDDDVDNHDDEREQNLTELRKSLDADLVVSAILTPESNSDRFKVEIELGIGTQDRWNEAAELVEDHQLFDGAWIGTKLDINAKTNASVAELLVPYLELLRAIALYANQNWQLAAERLSAALADPQTPENLETLAYVLKGNALGRMGSQEEAAAAYASAFRINSNYLRATLGLAEIDYQRALALNGSCRGPSSAESLSYLDAARTKYLSVLAVAKNSSIPDVDVRAKYGTGRIHACRLLLGETEEGTLAIRDLQFVTRRYEANTKKTWIKSVASGAYGELGLVRCWQGFRAVAIKDYQKAYKWAVDRTRAEQYAKNIDDIEKDPQACLRP